MRNTDRKGALVLRLEILPHAKTNVGASLALPSSFVTPNPRYPTPNTPHPTPRFPFWLLTLCLCISSVAGGSFLPPASAQATRFITEFRLDREVIDVPFEYKNHLIMLKGQINERKNLNLIFDTGATSLVLEKSLGLTGTHIADTQFHEAEGVTQAEAVWIDNVSVGEKSNAAQIHNVSTLLTDLSQMSRVIGQPLDGIFGMSCMAGYTVEIDYEKKHIRFLPSRSTR